MPIRWEGGSYHYECERAEERYTSFERHNIRESGNYFVCERCNGTGLNPNFSNVLCHICKGDSIYTWIDIPSLDPSIKVREVRNGVYTDAKNIKF